MIRSSSSILQSKPEIFQNAGEERSPIYFGRGILGLLPEILKLHDFDRLFVITDHSVERVHGKLLSRHLLRFRYEMVAFPGGESSKNLQTFERLVGELLERGATSESMILAFGGGVVGNLAGFVAATLFRGIGLAHMPTTFQAQTDSTLSRKQAVNCHGKNLIGCFYTPRFTLSDTDLLATEPRRSLLGGMAETIKNALISDERFYRELVESLSAEVVEDPAALHDLARRSIVTKLAILREDPTELGEAVILEYGHTLAHALETAAPGRFTHGECVGMGMVFSARLSRRLGILHLEDESAAESLLQRLGLTTRLPSDLTKDAILQAMRLDNKRRGKHIEFILLERTGHPHEVSTGYLHPVTDELILETMEDCRSREPGA